MNENSLAGLAAKKSEIRKVTIESVDYHIAEGDILLDDAQLAKYAEEEPAPADKDATDNKRLLGILDGGKIVRWKPGMELTYRILKSSFSTAEYELVRANMRQATFDWESLCGVQFRHLSELDASSTGAGALFVVRKVDTGGQLIAAAFFPNDPPSRRELVIDISYFSSSLSFDKVGVLRHELGHVLGFRHEHIKSGAPAICPDESLAGTKDLTDKYDPRSVMHYFCGGVGDPQLQFTDLDREGSQRVYGPPLAGFQLVE